MTLRNSFVVMSSTMKTFKHISEYAIQCVDYKKVFVCGAATLLTGEMFTIHFFLFAIIGGDTGL